MLTPEFGPRNRFGVILTQLEIEPDPMYDGERLCVPEKCGICTRVCPTKALSEVGAEDRHRINMGGRHIEYGKVNWEKCQSGTLGLKKITGGKEDFIDTSDPTPQDIRTPSTACHRRGRPAAPHLAQLREMPVVLPRWKMGRTF